MPRFFGVDEDESNDWEANTAYYGVDVNARGTVIAAGATANRRQLTDMTGE